MTGQLQDYTNRRIVNSDENFLGFVNTDKVDEHFLPGLEELCAGARRESEVDEAEEEMEVENVEENRRIMDTTGETERDDSTIHRKPSSLVFMLENILENTYDINGQSTSRKATLIRQIVHLLD
uniref:Uncharacterized protein n=1 Tax=Glossina palpalis gambiensis TaxID=67801 RepID=A0A1B0BE44_9MUSC